MKGEQQSWDMWRDPDTGRVARYHQIGVYTQLGRFVLWPEGAPEDVPHAGTLVKRADSGAVREVVNGVPFLDGRGRWRVTVRAPDLPNSSAYSAVVSDLRPYVEPETVTGEVAGTVKVKDGRVEAEGLRDGAYRLVRVEP